LTVLKQKFKRDNHNKSTVVAQRVTVVAQFG
jgi:hypothetical protein